MDTQTTLAQGNSVVVVLAALCLYYYRFYGLQVTKIQTQPLLGTSSLRDGGIQRLRWHFQGSVSFMSLSTLSFCLVTSLLQILFLCGREINHRNPKPPSSLNYDPRGRHFLCPSLHLFNFGEDSPWPCWGHMHISKPVIMAKGVGFPIQPTSPVYSCV